ncbi:ABC transporter substrate-binding protein [Ferrimonas senticii]|uniref:ABC transporter substrate-binding protein n=1 Tax=Ferrimonas senticii TaxID=394566 RepID=UPI00040CAE60|nr:ABC transporter substrate-binding protein [Ferrimonas senticii]
MPELNYQQVARKSQLKRGIAIALLAIASGSLCHFLLNGGPSDQTKNNTLAISGPWEFTSVEPAKHGYIFSRMQVIETLLNVNDSGELGGALASQWQISDDGLEWIFTLRTDVRFHDGSSMDADAVLRSLRHALANHGALRRAPIVDISSTDTHTVVIRLSQPYQVLGAMLTNYSAAILAASSYDDNGQVTALIGTGPYRLTQFEPPHKLLVQAFPDYWGQVGTIEYASYLTGHRAESRMLQAKSSEADIVFTLEPAMLPQLENAPVQIHSSVLPRSLLLKLNSGHPLLDSVATRQALSLALDRVGIAANVLNVPGTDSGQLLPASMPQWHQSNHHAEYNLDRAKQLLAEQGWQRGADGVLTKDGQRFELTLVTYADRPELTVVATAIQAQWAELGIDLAIDVSNSSMIPAGHNDGSLEVALMARNFATLADPLATLIQDYSNGGGDWGAMNWPQPQLDSAFAELQHGTEPQRARQLSQQIATTIAEQYPVLPIANYSQHTAVNNRVQNFVFDPYERSYFINQMQFKEQP